MSTKIPPHDRRADAPVRGDAAPPTRTSSHRPPLPATPTLLDAAAVAARLGLSPRTVRRLIAARELPVHRIGRSVRVSEDDLTRFLAAQRRREMCGRPIVNANR